MTVLMGLLHQLVFKSFQILISFFFKRRGCIWNNIFKLRNMITNEILTPRALTLKEKPGIDLKWGETEEFLLVSLIMQESVK